VIILTWNLIIMTIVGRRDGFKVIMKRVKHVVYVMHCLLLWIATWLVMNVHAYAGRMDNE